MKEAVALLRPEPPSAEVAQIHANIAACDRALHELLTAIVAYDTVAVLATREHAITLWWHGQIDEDRLAFEALIAHPVRHALREGVKRIGREVYRLGGCVGTMVDSADRVAEMDPQCAARRGSIINSAWNGIGKGDDRWWS